MASKPFFDAPRKTWFMKYKPRAGGPWVKVKLGRHPDPFPPSRPPTKPPRAIIDLAAEFEAAEVRAGQGLPGVPMATKGLAGYVHKYLETYKANRDASSYGRVKPVIDDFVKWCIGQGITELAQVTRSRCREFLEHRLSKVAINTVVNEKGWVGAIFSKAYDDELIPANPWHRLPMPAKKTAVERTFWSDEEIVAILESLNLQWHKDATMIAANTGIRIGAVLAMEWDWIQWVDHIIRVPAENSKNGKPLEVPMSDFAHDILLARLNCHHESPYVFPSGLDPSRPSCYTSFWRAFSKAIVRAGVKKGHPHDLRHTFGRTLMRSGAPINAVKASLGHANIATTQLYTDIDAEKAKESVKGLSIGKQKKGA